MSDLFFYLRFPSRMIKSPCLFSGRNKSNFIGFADGQKSSISDLI
nr:MAG TPA: hypothetical protein [Caudoviricetes sp.]